MIQVRYIFVAVAAVLLSGMKHGCDKKRRTVRVTPSPPTTTTTTTTTTEPPTTTPEMITTTTTTSTTTESSVVPEVAEVKKDSSVLNDSPLSGGGELEEALSNETTRQDDGAFDAAVAAHNSANHRVSVEPSGPVDIEDESSKGSETACEAKYGGDTEESAKVYMARRKSRSGRWMVRIQANCGTGSSGQAVDSSSELAEKMTDEMTCEEMFALIGITPESTLEDFEALCGGRGHSGRRGNSTALPGMGGPLVLTGIKRNVVINQEEQWARAGPNKKRSYA